MQNCPTKEKLDECFIHDRGWLVFWEQCKQLAVQNRPKGSMTKAVNKIVFRRQLRVLKATKKDTTVLDTDRAKIKAHDEDWVDFPEDEDSD